MCEVFKICNLLCSCKPVSSVMVYLDYTAICIEHYQIFVSCTWLHSLGYLFLPAELWDIYGTGYKNAYMSTVPHPEGQSRIFIRCPAVPRNQQMSRIFRKWYYYFFRCRLFYIYVCLATQQSDELRIKIGSKFARRQATDYKYTVL